MIFLLSDQVLGLFNYWVVEYSTSWMIYLAHTWLVNWFIWSSNQMIYLSSSRIMCWMIYICWGYAYSNYLSAKYSVHFSVKLARSRMTHRLNSWVLGWFNWWVLKWTELYLSSSWMIHVCRARKSSNDLSVEFSISQRIYLSSMWLVGWFIPVE